MQKPSRPAVVRRARLAKSCTECRKRKQKCVFPSGSTAGQPCNNCNKRFPPVDCVREEQTPAGAVRYDTEIQLLPSRPAPGSSAVSRPALLAPGSGQRPNLILDGRRTPERDDLVVVASPSCGTLVVTPLVGVLAEVGSCLSAPGIEVTPRNIELFHFFLRHIAPNMSSIDGLTMPKLFREELLPWMVQSPLMPHIALLMASTTQSLEQDATPHSPHTTLTHRAQEALTLRTRVLSRLNAFLQREAALHSTSPSADRALGEAIRSTINLTVAEWFWGDEAAMWAHFYGVHYMVQARGGLMDMGDPLCASVLVVTDFEIACYYERGLVLQGDEEVLCARPLPVFELPYLEFLASPLDSSGRSFRGVRSLGLGREVSGLLDDVRFLTRSVVFAAGEMAERMKRGREGVGGEAHGGDCETADGRAASTSSTAKLKATATWLHGRASVPPSGQTQKGPAAALDETIRLAALVYSWSIMHSRPSSEFATAHPEDNEALFTNMMATGMARWKALPGIFTWVLLVMCPSAQGSARRRYLRRKMAVAGMSVGHEDFPLSMSCFKAFWMVQRWVAAGASDRIVVGDGAVGRSGGGADRTEKGAGNGESRVRSGYVEAES